MIVLGPLSQVGILIGCSTRVTTPITISPQGASVRIGSTLALSVEQQTTPLTGAAWSVAGGPANGSIDASGIYSPPQSIPASDVVVTCEANGQTASTTIGVLNPLPVVSQISPARIVEVTSPIVVTGNGFVSGSQILAGGAPVATTFIDDSHLSATVVVLTPSVTSLVLAVSNPAPGAIVGDPLSVPVAVEPLTISPQSASVRLGTTLSLTGMQLGAPVGGGVWSVSGAPGNGSVNANGVYSPPLAIPQAPVTVTYQALGQLASSVLNVVNPLPVIDQIAPAKLIQLSSSITVTGTGFVSGSKILVSGDPVVTTLIDGSHLSATVMVPSVATTSLALAVENPAPGAVVGSSFSEPVSIAPVTISPQSASVRLGGSVSLTGMQLGAALSGGAWSVAGGSANGSITSNGLYSPPTSLPLTNVTATYQAFGQTATAMLTVLNPMPVVSQISPAKLIQLSTPITVAGSGFVSGSQILIGGTRIATTFIDGGHLSATAIVPNLSSTSVMVTVSNPNPGATSSSSVNVAVAIAPLTISPSPASVRLGNTLALSGVQQGTIVPGGIWTVAGGSTNGTIDANGSYSPPPTIASPSVSVSYQALGQMANSTLTLLNPLPTVTQISPSTFVQLSTSVIITGTGFVKGSQILIAGVAVATTFLDGHHLSGTALVASTSVTSLLLSVSNPSPGPTVCNPILVPVSIAPLTIFPQTASVRIGTTLILTGIQQGASLGGGFWSVTGGAANGSIDENGVYTPPLSIPSSTVTVNYLAVGQTATGTVTILNPTPAISHITPAKLTELSTPVNLTGSGFVNGSQILVGGAAIATTLIDSTHLSGTVVIPNISVSSLAITVSNPNPGLVVSSPAVLSVAIAPIEISPSSASVRVGDTLALSAQQLGVAVSGGAWSVTGGSVNGSIDANGVYTPPQKLQNSKVRVAFQALGQTTTITITLLNPVPVIRQVSPATLTHFSSIVTIAGSGFVAGSQVLSGGAPLPTILVDAGHLSATVPVASNTITSLTVTVSNPDPGALVSSPFSLPVVIGPLVVSPGVLPGGDITITASLPDIPLNSAISINGIPLTVTAADTTSITGTGYLPFWRTGPVTVAVAAAAGGAPFAQVDVPIAPTAVPYDVAARFAMQAGFGPRHDIIEHIQQIGLKEFVGEQLQLAPDVYTEVESPAQQYLLKVLDNNTQLRLRVAWAFQSFIPEQGIFRQASTLPWEQTLEAHAFGNFRQILLDATSDPNVTTLLNLPGNSVTTDPNVHPNQNFARELLQLFSIGSLMLNEDGTTQTDGSGNPIPAYGQDTILNISRALTGWNYAPTVNKSFSFYGIDYTQKLVATESRHDQGSKTVFGDVSLPAGQTAAQDRDQVLDAVFQHQNVPAFVSRRLIQRLVKSQPSPAYIARISAVFKDDGSGVRGNLAAVIKAILLDSEARAGDTTPSEDDGYVQDPLFAELFAMELMDIDRTDANASYYPSKLGEPWWFPPTVFAYYSPDYVIPGTAINSPEFQLLTTSLVVQRSQFLWGMINGPQTGFAPWGSTWLSTRFPTVPALVEALNHIAYHGTMSQFQQDTITNYCGGLAGQQTQLRCTLLLALNGDSYTVVH